MDWSYDRIYKLITMDGMAAKPEAHQGFVENPLVPVDYVTVKGHLRVVPAAHRPPCCIYPLPILISILRGDLGPVQTFGVQHIEDTEDFIDGLGHLAHPEDEANFNAEVSEVLSEVGLLFVLECVASCTSSMDR